MHELALFAGAGGGILGGHLLGWRTVCAVEWDAYAASVLVARQNDGCLPPFPIWDDVQTFNGKPWRGRVDVISGGFPCQDISAAGKGAGIEGERSGMWKHMARIIGEVLPRFVFVENSPMLVGRGLAVVLADLAEMGYDAEWGIVGAHHTGAPHKRDRIWIVANSNRFRELQLKGMFSDERGRTCDCGGEKPFRYDKPYLRCRKCGCRTYEALADAESTRLERHRSDARESEISEPWNDGSPAWMPCPCCDDWWCNIHGMHTGECPCPEIDEWDSDPYSVCHAAGAGLPNGIKRPMGQPRALTESERSDWWATEPDVGGMVDGMAVALDIHGADSAGNVDRVASGTQHRVDRLRCIGNGQVPAVAKLAFNLLKP
jgi:hypothetical protein